MRSSSWPEQNKPEPICDAEPLPPLKAYRSACQTSRNVDTHYWISLATVSSSRVVKLFVDTDSFVGSDQKPFECWPGSPFQIRLLTRDPAAKRDGAR